MNKKEKILLELQSLNFPDLKFLYSPEVLDIAPEVLDELLEEEKNDFQKKLSISDSEISFDVFDDFSSLGYFFGLLEHYQGVHNDEKIRKIIEDFEPKYIDFGNEIAYNKRWYEMHVYCFENCNLNQEEKRILEKTLKSYKVRGIHLPEEKQTRLKEISKEISEMSQKFSNNILDDRKSFEYIITDMSEILDMPQDDRDIAKKKAEDKKLEGYLFDASVSAYMTVMKYCENDEIRKHFYNSRIQFATQDPYDNRELVLQIINLRDEKAKILGYNNYAELSLEFKMAESPQQVMDLFSEISKKSRDKAQSELEELKEFFNLQELKAWDTSYYFRKLKEQKYGLDEKELKKYFVFENVLAGLFEIVEKLYGIQMKKVSYEVYDSDVEVYEVYKDGEQISFFLTDYFYNPLKRQGAWADLLREKEKQKQKIVVNVCNFQKNTQGDTLLSLGDVETLFHEFGHAIHEMLSVSDYSDLSGFHVEWDFVELPSQLLENWCRHRQGMKLFARHHETGEQIPEDMLQILQELDIFGNGNQILKQNEYALFDMAIHSFGIPQDIHELQKISDNIYKENSLFPLPDNYKTYASFSHIFDGGYAAGYYSYMWAEIIEKEVWNKFTETGDIFDPETAKNFGEKILSQGSRKEAVELFRDFIGREIQIDAFLEEKGIKS